MAMDFFEHQDVARRKSGLLIGYFIVAVILIVVSVYAAAVISVNVINIKSNPEETVPIQIWFPTLFWICSLATVVLVISGSVYKIVMLGDGGESVATMLGGHLLGSKHQGPQ